MVTFTKKSKRLGLHKNNYQYAVFCLGFKNEGTFPKP